MQESLKIREVVVRPVGKQEEARYQELMNAHHYLGGLPKIGETLWYVAEWGEQWVALVSFSAAAWKCRVRDEWIGWNWRHQYDRLKLVVNNSRFLILPEWHVANLGSRVLSQCEKRLGNDWRELFGHPVLLMETLVDSERFQGTVYPAIGVLKTNAITFSTGTTTKTAVASAQAMVPRTSLGCDALPSASSSPKGSATSLKKCENSTAILVWSWITCA